MTSSPSSSSINTLVTHHLITHHNNVGNYFNFICMKHTLTMLTLSKTFFFVGVTKTFSSIIIINNNFIIINKKLFHPSSSSTTTSSSSTKNFSFIIIPAKYKPSHWSAPPHGQHNHHRSVYPYNVDPNSTSYRYTSSCSP